MSARSLPPLPQYTCGQCGETFGSNCDSDDITCPYCESRRCPHCLKWFGSDYPGDVDEDVVYHELPPGQVAYEAYWRVVNEAGVPEGDEWEHVPPWAQAAWEAAAEAAASHASAEPTP